MDKPKILLAEDDHDFGNMLKQYLSMHEYNVSHAVNGAEAWDHFNKDNFDIAILDVMMPEMDGFNLAKKIKVKTPSFPLLFLTAKSMREDKIHGLELGADDYITKPFDPDELILRLKNILKRANINNEIIIELSSTSINCSSLVLNCSGDIRVVTPKEMELISFLLKNPNKGIAREAILKEIWGENDYFIGRSMDVFISRIRKYLSNDKSLKLRTIRGIGYILEHKNPLE
jgi:DNA-binding response OmpR family regulator